MSTNELIDAQFHRAVDIVQSLPKTGPIQTDYEEKLTMYSLYKQATAGNVTSPRPGMWDMLGRAKWDAWAKHKDLDPYEAKWLYVEALLKVLRKYSDKTIAQTLVEELESYGGDPSNIVMSRTLSSRSPGSDASGSTNSDVAPSLPRPRTYQAGGALDDSQDDVTSSEEETEDEAQELPALNSGRPSVDNRPQSSLSSQQRYRTPLAGSLAMSPPPSQYRVPAQQPLPGFETPSAFAEAPANPPPSSYQYARPGTSHSHRGSSRQGRQFVQYENPQNTLEHAVENVQVNLAALTERLETLEARTVGTSRSNISGSPNRGEGRWLGRRGSPNAQYGAIQWDIDDLGMWSLVLNPLSRGIDRLHELAGFLARNEQRTPSMIIIRRLFLDISFLTFVVAILGALWRKSGVRRREVKAALVILWRAIVGSKPPPRGGRQLDT